MSIYLDYNATTPLCEEAATAVTGVLKGFGNPSSQHSFGRTARGVLEKARTEIAQLLGADHDEIIFTSGATEAAQFILRQNWDHILVNSTEHACVRDGVKSQLIDVDANGHIDLEMLEKKLRLHKGRRVLVAVMAANNETGVLQPVQAVADLVHQYGAHYFCDAVQLMGKYNCTVHDIAADFISISAHKLGGTSGIGALWVKKGFDIMPILYGGGQEMKRRAGTENILGAVSFAAALRSARKINWHNIERLRDTLEQTLAEEAQGVVFFGQGVDRLPNTSCFALPNWRSEIQLMTMDLKGFAISAGSACSSGKIAPSHVLKAMGVPDDLAKCAVRISLTPYTTQEDIEAFTQVWLNEAARIQRVAA